MNPHPFDQLTPDFIIDAVEAQGWLCDGRLLALNSYENRVYQVGIEEQPPLIVKFYRPGRWTDRQIIEEHEFSYELYEQELPVVVPLKVNNASLLHYKDFKLALFLRQGGYAPELDHADNLTILGRTLARMHLIGSRVKFLKRPEITLKNYATKSFNLISLKFIPAELKTAYDSLCQDILITMEDLLHRIGPVPIIRVHGDCHAGNILWRDDAPHFVDFDDARMAPSIQDIWMLLSGDRQRQSIQLKRILDGYQEFKDFDFNELRLIEVFRTLRIMHYSAWLAKRWGDPAFPHSFPWFNTTRYWEEHILELREQYAALQEPSILPSP